MNIYVDGDLNTLTIRSISLRAGVKVKPCDTPTHPERKWQDLRGTLAGEARPFVFGSE